jgi:membrane protein implicated in regulation of membrane protease activity
VRRAFRELVTGKDNQTHDIARWVMLVNAVMLVVVLIIGVSAFVYGYAASKPFDLQTLLTSVLTYVGGVSALLTSGAAAIFFKRSTEPDGSSSETESIGKGRTAPETVNNVIVQD